MGNTVVGIADDFTALFGNPAGLSQQKSFEFSAGLSRLGFNNDVTFFGKKLTDDNNAINLNNLGIVYPIATIRGGLTFAFGFGRVANYTSIAQFDGFNPSSSVIQSLTPQKNIYYYSDRDWMDFLDNNAPYNLKLADRYYDTTSFVDILFPLINKNVQQTGTIREDGGLNHWSFGGAIDIARDLSMGVSLNFASGTYSYDRTYVESDPQNLHNVHQYLVTTDMKDFTWQSSIKSELSGFNALFGFMYRKPGKLRVGATVRTPTTYEISENFTNDYQSRFDNGDMFQHSTGGSTNYKVVTPLVLSCGMSVQLIDWILLAGDAEYTDWTQMEFDTENPDLIQENRNIKKWMRDTWNLRGGVEVSLLDFGLKLRGGVEWKPSPWEGDPSNYDQLLYTGGIGYSIDESSTINASFGLGTWKTFRDNYYWGDTPASRTRESVTTQVINITFSHRF
jgi:long-subunit fatty acid transport protein